MNKEYLKYKKIVDEQLYSVVPSLLAEENPLRDVMQYSVSAEGKRIRGVLTLVFCQRLGVSLDRAIPFAVALEMIHSYSLVHDDMPEMDNDDFRRGMPTCHKKFGASSALLAGDGILNLSIEYLLSKRNEYSSDRFLKALMHLYEASGANGMLLGQMLDKDGEKRLLSEEELLELHRRKTGALLLAPILIAQALSDKQNENYVNYSKSIGLAFQIKDDLLDLEGDAELLGKDIKKDSEENKSTFISVLGAEKTRISLEREISQAKETAEQDELLLWLADYIKDRQK